MREQKNSENPKHMLDYLISLLDDVNDFSWDVAKASHTVLMCHMEQEKVADYTQIDNLVWIRKSDELKATKNLAFSLFNRQRMFKETESSKSYANVLKKAQSNAT